MSAGHTPGPWEHVRLSGVCGPHAIRMTYNGDKTFYGVREIACEEDARLIAAAPALLLELEMTVDLLERASRTLTEECKSALEGRQWGGVRIASARAAIALAKGESA